MISWNVPTPEELNGDFSYGGRSGVNAIYDPRTTAVTNGVWSRTPFPGNIIPKAQWDPVATKFLGQKVWEVPNSDGTPTATGVTGNLQLPRQKITDWANYSLRTDHQFGSSLKMFYNWSFNTRTAFTPNLNVVEPALQLLAENLHRCADHHRARTTYTIAPTMISETRVNYYRFRNDTTWPGYGTNFCRPARHPQHRGRQHAA